MRERRTENPRDRSIRVMNERRANAEIKRLLRTKPWSAGQGSAHTRVCSCWLCDPETDSRASAASRLWCQEELAS